ncbi:MAG: transporter associated domain-containing protein, partial [Exilispira sp.]
YSLQKKISKIGLFIEDAIKFDEIALYEIQKPLFSYPSLTFDENNKLDISQIYENSERNYIVYDENNNFLGILNIDSIFHSGNIKTIYKKNEIPLINNIPVAYEGKNLLVAIELMKKNNSSFLITINEFGQYFGLITKEDLFSFFSNIIISKEDLYKFNIKKVGEKTYIVPGFTELTSLSRVIGFELTDDYYHTFNGYLINRSGKIPKEGEMFIIDNFLEVRIVSANKKFVEKAIVKIIGPKEEKIKND